MNCEIYIKFDYNFNHGLCDDAISDFCSEIQSWVFNIKTQSGLVWLLLWIQTCFLFDIQGFQVLVGQIHAWPGTWQLCSWTKFVFAPLPTVPQEKTFYVKMKLRGNACFRPDRAVCVCGWLVRDCRGCSCWSLCCLIRAEHPETASNDKGIGIKSQKYLESNWSG